MKSYKIHVQETVPEDEWFIVENTHQPIIKREDFEKVQELLKKTLNRNQSKKSYTCLAVFFRCADCGKAMTRSEVKEMYITTAALTKTNQNRLAQSIQ